MGSYGNYSRRWFSAYIRRFSNGYCFQAEVLARDMQDAKRMFYRRFGTVGEATEIFEGNLFGGSRGRFKKKNRW